jgi:hypothetical protein
MLQRYSIALLYSSADPPLIPRPTYRVLVLSSISTQLVETECKELEGVYRIGWAGLTQRVWNGTHRLAWYRAPRFEARLRYRGDRQLAHLGNLHAGNIKPLTYPNLHHDTTPPIWELWRTRWQQLKAWAKEKNSRTKKLRTGMV